jgi:hypothetical protein
MAYGRIYGEFDPHDSIEGPLQGTDEVEVSVQMMYLRDNNLGKVLDQLRAFDGDEAKRHHFFTQLKVQVTEIINELKTTPEYEAYQALAVKPGDTPTRGYNTRDTYDGYVLYIDLKICNVAGIMGTIPMRPTKKHTGVLTIFRDIVKAIDGILSRYSVVPPIVSE